MVILNSDFPTPTASICCYLLEVANSENKTRRVLPKNMENGPKMAKIEKKIAHALG